MKLQLFIILGVIASFVQSKNFLSKQKDTQQIFQKSSIYDQDLNTFSNFHEVRTSHFDLDWNINFERQELYGNVTLTMTSQIDNLRNINLDIWNQRIEQVLIGGSKQQFKVIEPQNEGDQGQQLAINLTNSVNKDQDVKLTVQYTLTNNSKSLSFLRKEQTGTKTQPYIFTQCEPIYARSLIPLQDTPQIKATYKSRVTVPNGINVFMSANKTGTFQDSLTSTHTFDASIPIPSYLVAIIAGNVTEQQVGKNTYVIAEGDIMPKSLLDLENLQGFLDAVENYIQIPYIWGVYKIVIMPPSFPIGGMENPLLTFASPSIITGDKSGTSVAIHEIAHSWTGNMVTCGNWSSLWLNEGFTVFLERQGQIAIYGQDFMTLDAMVGNNSLISEFNTFGYDSNFTSLFPQVGHRNPDDAFSEVPYEKGFQFLYFLQDLIGYTPLRNFLTSWVAANSKKSMVWEDLRASFQTYIRGTFPNNATEILSKVDWEGWITAPGLPPMNDLQKIHFHSPLQEQAQNLAQGFIDAQGNRLPNGYQQGFNFTTEQKYLFIEYLRTNIAQVKAVTLDQIDNLYDFTHSFNKEIQWRWFQTSVLGGYNKNEQIIHTFLGSIGRQKMINPIYSAYVATGQRQYAISVFQQYENFYHPIAVISIKAILGITDQQSEFIEY